MQKKLNKYYSIFFSTEKVKRKLIKTKEKVKRCRISSSNAEREKLLLFKIFHLVKMEIFQNIFS